MDPGRSRPTWATAVNNGRLLTVVVSAFVLSGSSVLASDDYFACSSCHGEKGEGVAAKNAPALAGLDRDYVRQQMSAFKEGRRGADPEDRFGVQMALIAAAYDDATIDRLSVVIEGFPVSEPANHNKPGGDVRRGRTLYALCSSCHGEKGEGSPMMGAPRIAGQEAAYFVRQLTNFRDGLRGAHPDDTAGAQMGRIVRAGLTGQTDFDDLAAFVDSLPH